MTNSWPDPNKPGYPLNPNQNGYHWLIWNGAPEAFTHEWRAATQSWSAYSGGDCVPTFNPQCFKYLGPCLLPSQIKGFIENEIAERYHPTIGTEWQKGGSLDKLLEQERQVGAQEMWRVTANLLNALGFDYVVEKMQNVSKAAGVVQRVLYGENK